MIKSLVIEYVAGFLQSKFDSTYPVQLNGIIYQNEFHESIKRINRRISSNKILIFLAFVLVLSIISGILLFIIDAIPNHSRDSRLASFGNGKTHSHSDTSLFSPLIGIGIGLFIFGLLFAFIGCCMIQYQRKAQIQQVITEESMKYTLRSPIPCSWRLETNRVSVLFFFWRNVFEILFLLVNH